MIAGNSSFHIHVFFRALFFFFSFLVVSMAFFFPTAAFPKFPFTSGNELKLVAVL